MDVVLEWASTLPPYLKYVVLTAVPLLELRASILMAVQQGEQIYLPVILLTNCLVFFPTYFILAWVYELIPEGSWLHRKLERVRAKAHPLVEKYGVIGLALFVAIPLPGTGAYSGAAAAWLLDMHWHKAFWAVALGVLGAFLLMWGFYEGIAAGLNLF
ncbi:MAG: small multi-drug export protein [Actinomycetota bacterium]|nr:small multi-drug export protein [Actinomycetota bacterium]